MVESKTHIWLECSDMRVQHQQKYFQIKDENF